jgi:integrase
MTGWDYDMQVNCIRHFYAFCLSERGMAASTIQSCSSAVKKVFRDKGLSVEAFEDSRCKNVRAGADRWDALFRERSVQKLPVSGDMIRKLADKLALQGGQRGHMLAAAALLGFYSALRVCEYVLTGPATAESHVITAADIAFLCIGTGSKWVAAWALVVEDLPHVQQMLVTLRSAKNDQKGKGESWSFYKGQDEHGGLFIDQMARWATQAHSDATDPFISYRDPITRNLSSLKYHSYNTVIKAAAEDCGLDPAHFSTHSVRKGALSQLTAAGVSLDAVQRAARHKSAISTFKYQSTSVKEREQVVKALASDGSFGQQDIHALQVTGRNLSGKKGGSSGGRGSA